MALKISVLRACDAICFLASRRNEQTKSIRTIDIQEPVLAIIPFGLRIARRRSIILTGFSVYLAWQIRIIGYACSPCCDTSRLYKEKRCSSDGSARANGFPPSPGNQALQLLDDNCVVSVSAEIAGQPMWRSLMAIAAQAAKLKSRGVRNGISEAPSFTRSACLNADTICWRWCRL